MINEHLKSVAIVAMGASANNWLGAAVGLGTPRRLADETWVINSMGCAIQHDRMFLMDDLDILRAACKAEPESMVGGLLDWLHLHQGPIYVPRVHPGYPGMVEYPLEEVVNCIGIAYLNTSVAYALAYAIYLKVEKIGLYGCDFTYPDKHISEAGRGCCEFLMGIAGARGIQLLVASTSTLLDANVPPMQRFYGYPFEIRVESQPGGKIKLIRPDRPAAAPVPEPAVPAPAPLRLTGEVG